MNPTTKFSCITNTHDSIAHDEWADWQQPNAGETPIEGNAYGNIRDLYTIKKHNRKVKTLLSIGGWETSQAGKFQVAAKTAASRKRFADSAVQLMADYGMDGIDIDWEYPNTSAEGVQLLELLKAVRTSLNTYATKLGQTYKYSLTVATPGASAQYNKFPLSKINAVVDHFHVMSYEYSAPGWDTTVGHASALYLDKTNKLATKIVVNQAVTNYKKLGVTPKKITVGIPLYGRSFAGTAGVGKSHKGPGYTSPGSEKGTALFKHLPRPGAKVTFRTDLVATYSYDAAKKELISFDNSGGARVKSQYVVTQKLGGVFFWEASGDKKGSASLMKIASDNLGKLDTSLNQLSYPNSRFENIKKQMPGSKAPPGGL